MRWKGRRESDNVEDRRSLAGPGVALGGIGSVVLVVLYLLLGGDPQALMNSGGPGLQPQSSGTAQIDPAEEEAAKFVRVVLADTEDVWNQLLPSMGRPYQEPRLVLFRGRVESACGLANAAVGPFYCPADQQVYLDLQFFDELRARFGAPGDFAQAYVVAHEVGHHVQQLLGISEQVHRQQQALGETQANQLSVRLELQADFLAGVWAHHVQRQSNILDPGDLEEGLTAANAIGDDRLQKQGQGYVVPDSFTHGTSAQRIKWFRRGYESGDLSIAQQLFQMPYGDL
jgi:predicted metalloprotease